MCRTVPYLQGCDNVQNGVYCTVQRCSRCAEWGVLLLYRDVHKVNDECAANFLALLNLLKGKV
jgi:hypothetical protein